MIDSIWMLLTEPVVDPKVWHKVPNKHVVRAKGLAQVNKRTDRDGQTNVAQHNEFGVLGFKERASRVEVVDTVEETVLLALASTFSLALMEVVASNVGHKVVGPTNQLLADEMKQSHDGSLFTKFSKLMNQPAKSASLLFTGARDENHVSLHVAGCLVVLAVGDLPAEVRNEESRVKDPANSVVENL
jgi:hypothetical protein